MPKSVVGFGFGIGLGWLGAGRGRCALGVFFLLVCGGGVFKGV